MDEQIEEEISHDDNTPSILDQAHKNGWNAGYYHFGKAEGNFDYFNPSIIERDDGIWLIVRRSEPHPLGFRFGQNYIWAFLMDEAGKTPRKGIRLRWKEEIEDQHFEDPRGFYNPNINQTLISACTFVWYPEGRWTGAHQCIGSFDDEWVCSKMDYPRIGGNPGELRMITDKKQYEKNWLPFLHDNHLHILYKADPWILRSFGATWSDVKEYRGEGVKWAHGDVRGGTSPVLVDGHYFTFPHSSLPWRGRYRRYYAGALAFEATPPFTPRFITPEPILRGSQNDPWQQRKPLVVFPCGALYKDGTWLVTMGVNDIKAAWVEIPHEDILKRMVPIRKSSPTVFPASGLSETEKNLSGRGDTPRLLDGPSGVEVVVRGSDPRSLDGGAEQGLNASELRPESAQKLSDAELLKQKRQANAAKARAALAAKRERDAKLPEGWESVSIWDKPKKKRRRKRFKRVTSEARMKALAEYEKAKQA